MVVIKPSDHRADLLRYSPNAFAARPSNILEDACPKEFDRLYELLQSSFDQKVPASLIPQTNGFINTVIQAYSKHQHLKLRPEDVWCGVLSQLNYYINAHSEELRDKFVAHEGKKDLILTYDACNRYTVDIDTFARQMGVLLQESIVDAELRQWMMPAFSTTTQHDTVIASIMMMSTMQAYFSYGMCLDCGFPSVTLLGEKADYAKILTRLEKLRQWGDEPKQFCSLLEPVIRRFIRSFEAPGSSEVTEFWTQAFSRFSQMSGVTIYSGWITAFCFWDKDGKSLKAEDRSDDRLVEHLGKINDSGETVWEEKITERLELDGVLYHRIDSEDIPNGTCCVPVTVDDNGEVFQAELIAGTAGMNCTSSGEESENGEIGLDTVQPQTGWWFFQKVPEKYPDPMIARMQAMRKQIDGLEKGQNSRS